MKRTLLYISVFFGICYLLGNVSERMTQRIYFSYAPDVINELQERLNQNETLYLDGQMLQAYIISSGEDEVSFDNNIAKWNNLATYVSSVGNKYKVVKSNGQLSIISLDSINKTSLSAIKSLDRVILTKNIVINIVGIAVTIAMYKVYNSRKRINTSTIKIVDEPT